MFSNSRLRRVALGLVVVLSVAGSAFAARKHSLLVVLTHGDDVASIAPLLAKSAAAGHDVYYAIFPGVQAADEAGTELQCGAKAMGVKQTFVLRGPAGTEQPAVKAIAERLIEIVNETRPDVIVTWGPDGLTGHPRHILVSNVVTRVFQQRGLLAHKPRKLYYIAYPESRFPESRSPFAEVADENGPFGTIRDDLITTRVDGSRFLKQTREALACFASHTIADNEVFQRVWYHRAASTLGGTVFLRLVMPASGKRETDIFQGL